MRHAEVPRTIARTSADGIPDPRLTFPDSIPHHPGRNAEMRMLVLGAGLQGSACAYDLLQQPDVTEVRLADLHPDHLPDFLAPYSGRKLIPTPVDVREREGVRALVRESNAVMCALQIGRA